MPIIATKKKTFSTVRFFPWKKCLIKHFLILFKYTRGINKLIGRQTPEESQST